MVAAALLLARPASAGVTPWGDPSADVSLPNADLISGLAAVHDGLVSLRATFADRPFPDTATHFVDWCMDLDDDPATGTVCGGINGYPLAGADAAVSLRSVPGHPFPQDFLLLATQWPPTLLDAAANLEVDLGTNTVCVVFPQTLLSDDGVFRYTVGSIFGGSGGANDAAPDAPGFGSVAGFFAGQAEDPGPCARAPPGEPERPGGGDPPANPPAALPDDGPAEVGLVQGQGWVLPLFVVLNIAAAIGVVRRRRTPPK